ncbi:hypothetical protein ACFLVY_01680 [Chloroflexota bacterium]
MTREVNLLVNEQTIELDYFVQGFIDHTIAGMLESLEGVGTVDTADINIRGDNVNVTVNNNEVPLNPFVTRIIRNTVIGMLSSLKGVSDINTVRITTQR